MDEEQARMLAVALSEQGGENAAIVAALCGLFRAYATGQPLRKAVHEHLERAYANELGTSLNTPKTQAFEELRELFLAALQPPTADSPAAPGGASPDQTPR